MAQARRLALLLAAAVSLPSLAAADLAQAPAPAAAPAAAARKKPTFADTLAAQKRIGEADKAYRRKDFAVAAATYQAAYDLDPRPSALRGLARSLREQKRYAASYAAWERLRTTHAKAIGPLGVAEADKALAELAALTGTVAVKGTEGAEAKLDAIAVGVLPLAAPVRVDPGTHRIEVAKPGFDPVDRTVEVTAGQAASIEAELAPERQTGTVNVREQAGAADLRVLVDGAEVGSAPWEGELAPGTHVIELRGRAIASARQTVEVTPRSRQEVVLQAVVRRGSAAVSATPAAARIAIDGVDVGAGRWDGELDVGAHEVKVTAPGFVEQTRTIEVAEDAPVALDLALVAAPPAAAAAADSAAPRGRGERGLYVNLDLLATWPTRVPGYGCPSGGSCSPEPTYPSTKLPGPSAGGLVARVGYRRDWLGVELVGAALGDVFAEKNEYRPTTFPNTSSPVVDDTFPRVEGFLRYSYGGFAGLGARAIAPVAFEPTAGLALGAVYRHMTLVRKMDGGVSDDFTASDQYVAPALMADVAVRIAFVRLGLVARVEIVGDDRHTEADPGRTTELLGKTYGVPTPEYPLTRGSAQIFLGPSFGLVFGK